MKLHWPRSRDGPGASSAPDFSEIQSHSYHGINSKRIESVDFLLFSNTTGDHQVPFGRMSDGMNRLHCDSAHQALGVDVSIKKGFAERFQLANHIDGGDVCLLTPAVNGNSTSARVDSKYQRRFRDRICKSASVLAIDTAIGQQRRADNHLTSPQMHNVLRSFRGANATARRTGYSADNVFHEQPVVANAARCVEVDQLHHGVFRKAIDPIIEVVELQFLPFSLDQLNDFASHEVD